MRYALLTAALVGCYSPSYSDCSVTCPAGSCPSGLECDPDGYCRASGYTGTCSEGDAGGGTDTDGDRVPDNQDNCPAIQNTDQNDEDADGKGDACDPCPVVSSMGATEVDVDSDGDGIGDGCDPNSDLNTDQVLVFDGFGAGTTGNQSATTPFVFGDGTATAIATTPDQFAEILWTPTNYQPGQFDVHVFAALSFNTLNPVMTGSVLGAGAGTFSGPGAGLTCEAGMLDFSAGGYVTITGGNGDSSVGSAPGNFTTGDSILISWTWLHDGSSTCLVGLPNQMLTPPTAAASAPLTSESFGIHIRGVSASFEWVWMIESAAP